MSAARAAPGYPFSVRARVAFSDTDTTGVLYYARFPAYFDRGIFDCRRRFGIPMLGVPGHRYVIRALSASYHASLRFDEEIEVFVRVAQVGSSSHTWGLRVERLDPGGPLLAADGEVTVVGVDEYGGRPTPMPPEVRDPLVALLEDGGR